jgi:hypothetical protein
MAQLVTNKKLPIGQCLPLNTVQFWIYFDSSASVGQADFAFISPVAQSNPV